MTVFQQENHNRLALLSIHYKRNLLLFFSFQYIFDHWPACIMYIIYFSYLYKLYIVTPLAAGIYSLLILVTVGSPRYCRRIK